MRPHYSLMSVAGGSQNHESCPPVLRLGVAGSAMGRTAVKSKTSSTAWFDDDERESKRAKVDPEKLICEACGLDPKALHGG